MRAPAPSPSCGTSFAAERAPRRGLNPILVYIVSPLLFWGTVIFLIVKGILPMSIAAWIAVALVVLFGVGLFFLLRELPFMDREGD